MKPNRQTTKKVIESVEFFYDHSYKRSNRKQLEVLGEERFKDEWHGFGGEEAEYFQPKPFEDLIEIEVVAKSTFNERYVVVFGVGATYQVEAPDMYESTGGSYTNNAFALVDNFLFSSFCFSYNERQCSYLRSILFFSDFKFDKLPTATFFSFSAIFIASFALKHSSSKTTMRAF